eukprot:gene8149-9021_t
MPVDISNGTSENEDVDFQWIGEGVEKEKGVISYDSCLIDGEKYSIDDNVIIKGHNDETYVANIKSFQRKIRMKDQNRVTVCWYFKSKDILPRKLKQLTMNLLLSDKELLKPLPDADNNYFPSSIEDIDAETIESKCSVKEIHINEEVSEKNFRENEYVTRYGFLPKALELFSVINYIHESVVNQNRCSTRKTPSRSTASTAKKPSSKRKASRSIPDIDNNEIIVSKKNKKGSSSKNEKSLDVVSPRTKAFNATQALGELLKESEDEEDNDVFEFYSSDEKSSLASETKEAKRDNNNNKKGNPRTKTPTGTRPARRSVARTQPQSTGSEAKSHRALRSRTVQSDILITTPADGVKAANKKTPIRKSIVASSARKSHSRVNETQPRVSEDDSSDNDDYKPEQDHSDEEEDGSGSEAEYEDEVAEISSDSDFQAATPKKSRSKAKRRPRLTLRKSRPKTPRTPLASCNTPKSVKTPRSIGKRLMTPSITDRNLPCATPRTPLEHARQRLHVSAVPDSLPCREQEFADIYSFIHGKLSSDIGG